MNAHTRNMYVCVYSEIILNNCKIIFLILLKSDHKISVKIDFCSGDYSSFLCAKHFYYCVYYYSYGRETELKDCGLLMAIQWVGCRMGNRNQGSWLPIQFLFFETITKWHRDLRFNIQPDIVSINVLPYHKLYCFTVETLRFYHIVCIVCTYLESEW